MREWLEQRDTSNQLVRSNITTIYDEAGRVAFFALLNEEQRREFIARMLGEPGQDKVVGMVYLWLDECMDEGGPPYKDVSKLVTRC